MIRNLLPGANPGKLFVIAGMPRGGTTYLFEALRAHPAIFLPHRKELAFFSANFAKGGNWYKSFFEKADEGQLCADVSPDYFLYPEATERILAFDPKIKVILAVRDPAAWAVSYHRHIATFQWNVPSFRDFIESHSVPNNKLLNRWQQTPKASFSIENNLVQSNVERYRRTFGSNLLLYSFDYFCAAPLAILQAIERFLGLSAVLKEEHLPPGAINSSRRRNIKLISYLLSREELINVAERVLPSALLQRTRSRIDCLSIPRRATNVDPALKNDLDLAKTRLSGDRKYVNSLFSVSPIQLGNGQPLN